MESLGFKSSFFYNNPTFYSFLKRLIKTFKQYLDHDKKSIGVS